MPINAELLAACLQPISPEAPAGADLRHDVRIDAIKEARREDLLPGPDFKAADWAAVVAQCSTMLQKDTKDLQLTAWLTEALMRRTGLPGLHTGIAITRGLVEQFWDTVYPLPQGDNDFELRAGPLEWMGAKLSLPLRLSPVFGRFSCADVDTTRGVPSEQSAQQSNEQRKLREEAVAAGKPTPEEIEEAQQAMSKAQLRAAIADAEDAVRELTALEAFCDERMGQDAPSFGSLRTAIDEPRRLLAALLAERLANDPDPVEEEPLAESVAGESDAPSEGDAALTPEPTSAVDAGRRVGVVARWLRQQQRTDPTPYRLLRGFRWGELLATAPQLNVRLLEAPPTNVRSKLRSLYLEAKWSELLEQGETLMATPAGRGWLDLQRYVYTAATNLGAEYASVSNALRAELRMLLATFPTLPRLTLMDETPTANDETRAWIAETIVSEEAPDGPSDSTGDRVPSDGVELVAAALAEDRKTGEQGGLSRVRGQHPEVRRADPFDQALVEQRAGRPQMAIELLTAELQRERSPRGRFLRQTQIAYVMVEAGLTAVAHPILQQLIEQIDERKLEGWESGPLVAQPMALMYRVLVARNENSGEQEKLYLRVCRLDPIQALGLRS